MLIMSRNSKVELWNGSSWLTLVINEATIFVPFRSLLHEWTPFYASISLINTYLYPWRNVQFQMLIFLLLISLPFGECFWQKQFFRQISNPTVRHAFQQASKRARIRFQRSFSKNFIAYALYAIQYRSHDID